MSYSLKSLKGVYIREYIGDYYRGYYTSSLDYSSCSVATTCLLVTGVSGRLGKSGNNWRAFPERPWEAPKP